MPPLRDDLVAAFAETLSLVLDEDRRAAFLPLAMALNVHASEVDVELKRVLAAIPAPRYGEYVAILFARVRDRPRPLCSRPPAWCSCFEQF
jgi:hypothetical protein